MFFQRDYVLRMIQMMGDFMRRIAQLLDEAEKRRDLDAACREKCGLSLQAADGFDTDSLAELLPPEPRLVLSELYYIRARHTQLPQEEREAWLTRSARLLLSLGEESLICQERKARLHEIGEEISLSPQEQLAAFGFYLEGEAFDWAEDALFFALEGGAPGAQAAGLAGFEGLEELSDRRLAAGGLPRKELEALLSELKSRSFS